MTSRYKESIAEEDLRIEVQQRQGRIRLERLKDQGQLEALQAAETAYQKNAPQGNLPPDD